MKAIRSSIRAFGTPKAPFTALASRLRAITPVMLDALKELLLERPDRHLDELVVFLQYEFEVGVSISTVSRALKTAGWPKKTVRRKAKEQNADLRARYMHELTACASHHLVYIDESGCDKRVGFRRTAWSPLPSTDGKVSSGPETPHTPSVYQDGILMARIYQGPTDSEVFEDFIEELLQWCGKWPQPKSVLVMDNASFHRTNRVEELCAAAGVILTFLHLDPGSVMLSSAQWRLVPSELNPPCAFC